MGVCLCLCGCLDLDKWQFRVIPDTLYLCFTGVGKKPLVSVLSVSLSVNPAFTVYTSVTKGRILMKLGGNVRTWVQMIVLKFHKHRLSDDVIHVFFFKLLLFIYLHTNIILRQREMIIMLCSVTQAIAILSLQQLAMLILGKIFNIKSQ